MQHEMAKSKSQDVIYTLILEDTFDSKSNTSSDSEDFGLQKFWIMSFQIS